MKHEETFQKIVTKRADGRKRVVTMPVGKTRTQDQFKKDCDVNEIVAKYRRTGSVTHVRNAASGVYADLTELPMNLMEAQQVVLHAQQAFETVPSAVRNRFGHDPNQLISFLADPANKDEAIKLGLVTPPPPIKSDPILTELQILNKNLNPKKKPTPNV